MTAYIAALTPSTWHRIVDIVNVIGARIAPGVAIVAIAFLVLLSFLVMPWIGRRPRAEELFIRRVMGSLMMAVFAGLMVFILWVGAALIIGIVWEVLRRI